MCHYVCSGWVMVHGPRAPLCAVLLIHPQPPVLPTISMGALRGMTTMVKISVSGCADCLQAAACTSYFHGFRRTSCFRGFRRFRAWENSSSKIALYNVHHVYISMYYFSPR